MNITSKLAEATLKEAIIKEKITGNVILHSDQGSQFTSDDFSSFCSKNGVIQSMSRAGCPYDNAPMERFFNTLKNEFFYHYYFSSFNELNSALLDYIFIWYNYQRPHSFNNGFPPALVCKFNSLTA